MLAFVSLPLPAAGNTKTPRTSAHRASVAPVCAGDRSSCLTQLSEWFTTQGVDLSRVCIRQTVDKGFCLCAAAQVPPRARLVSIPERLTLRTPVELPANEEVGDPWFARMALQIASESVGPSPLAPYLRSLPSESDYRVSSGPLVLWSEDEVKLLQCEMLGEIASAWRERALQSFNSALRRGTHSVQLLSPEQWMVHVANSLSRVFMVDHGRTALLSPLIDMANHAGAQKKINAKTVWNRRESAFELVASRQLTAGEEILVSYGTMPSMLLMLLYGFIEDDAGDHDRALLHCGSVLSRRSREAQRLVDRGLLRPDSHSRASMWQPATEDLRESLRFLTRDASSDAVYVSLIDQRLAELGEDPDKCISAREKMALRFRSAQRVLLLRERERLIC